MITPPPGARVYLACGYTDMRKGMGSLAVLVQQTLGRDPFLCEAVYAFRGRRGGLMKLLWHDGVGMCLLIKRLERGQFIWPMSASGTVSLTPGQLSTLLEGCEWRATARNLRPELAG
jgi:transposase